MFDIEGSGTSWFVTRNGQMVGSPTGSRLLAQTKADRLAREARVRVRPCLRCGTKFESEGPHNRMCNPCRGRSDDWMSQLEYPG
jgi:tRNA(Ile2) C34 agmatinyltransferase TiaS